MYFAPKFKGIFNRKVYANIFKNRDKKSKKIKKDIILDENNLIVKFDEPLIPKEMINNKKSFK